MRQRHNRGIRTRLECRHQAPPGHHRTSTGTRRIMAGESTFDVVSKVDKQEVANALNQAQKELAQRYDFKGVGAEVDFSGEKILL